MDFPSGDYLAYSPNSPRPPGHLPSISPRPLQQLHSYSTTNLTTQTTSMTPTHYGNRGYPAYSPTIGVPDHPSSCPCEACLASKYRMRDPSPSSRDLRPPEPPITLRPEKPKGWIRRLSMPVMGGAFSSDSKKGISNLAISNNSPVSFRNSLAATDETGRLRYDIPGNRSTTTLGR